MQLPDISGLTMALNKFTVAAGTTTTLSTTGTNTFCINGKAYTRTALTNQATPTTDVNTSLAFVGVKANKGSIYLIGFDSGGNIKVAQGEITDLDASGAFAIAPEFPLLPDTVCPVAYLVIKAGSTADATTGWIFGSTNNSGVTGITYTFVDIIALPNRPQIS